jgi:hypothetical protein
MQNFNIILLMSNEVTLQNTLHSYEAWPIRFKMLLPCPTTFPNNFKNLLHFSNSWMTKSRLAKLATKAD